MNDGRVHEMDLVANKNRFFERRGWNPKVWIVEGRDLFPHIGLPATCPMIRLADAVSGISYRQTLNRRAPTSRRFLFYEDLFAGVMRGAGYLRWW